MLYTLLKFLGWGALLAFIGGCIGWALRALKCRGEVARARAATVDHDEVERMRHRLANLEQVVAERDRLRIQLADVRHADSPGVVGAPIEDIDVKPAEAVVDVVADEPPAEPAPSIVPPEASEPQDGDTGDGDTGDGNTVDGDTEIASDGSSDGSAGSRVAGLMAVPDLVDDTDTDTDAGAGSDADSAATVDSDAETEASPQLDLAAAAAVIGKKIKLDDLTVVEGIGPKISQLCSGIGITSWRQLADTDIAELQSMLDAAGSRYSVHKPGTWSRQAALLAAGEWEAFKTLTSELDGGR